ncbi:hypothetical protein B0J14DRAFT_481665 [Halenospora varia]|nr:hypothetical protein B0J14DRAFT_481665 [Halenospora varia]
MDSTSSPGLPLTSDPALQNWEEETDLSSVPSCTNSDDLEALHQVQEESTALKNKAGIVIQHRAWQLGEAFRSEGDYSCGKIPSLRLLLIED